MENETAIFDAVPTRILPDTIENIPAGWRAKETYKLAGEDEFIEIFELAEPNKDFYN